MAGGAVGDGKFVKLLANPCCCQIRQLRVGGRWTCEQAGQVDATLIWVWDKMRQSGHNRAKSCLLQPLRPGPSNLLPADDVYVCKPLFWTPSLIFIVDFNMFACSTINSQCVVRILEQLKSKDEKIFKKKLNVIHVINFTSSCCYRSKPTTAMRSPAKSVDSEKLGRLIPNPSLGEVHLMPTPWWGGVISHNSL